MTLRKVTDRLSGLFLLSRGVTTDSDGNEVLPYQSYLVQRIDETGKWIITKSFILSEANQN